MNLCEPNHPLVMNFRWSSMGTVKTSRRLVGSSNRLVCGMDDDITSRENGNQIYLYTAIDYVDRSMKEEI